MIELICALAIGMVFGYLLKTEQKPPLVDVLQKQVEYYEEEVAYYKDLCKWHTDKNLQVEPVDKIAASFEEGRQQGMKQERALWQLAASSQEIGYE